MGNWQKQIWIGLVILAILFIIYQISTFDELQENPELQENLLMLNEKSNELLELCMETEELATLEGCKDASIPNIIELCQDRETSTMSVCLDARINEFSYTIDQRIKEARDHIEE